MEYQVVFEPFSLRHYIKTFSKKYGKHWDATYASLCEEFQKIDLLFRKQIAEYITDKNAEMIICKTEFRIVGLPESRHGSGNRCIVAIHKNENKVKVLLVYHKNDLGGGSETGNWKSLIRENYPEYSDIL